MLKSKKGFTIGELLIVILVLTFLVSILAPFIIHTTAKILNKSKAAADAATLRTTLQQINISLLSDKGMGEITKSMQPVKSKLDPDAVLWVNYSKPVTLEVYFVNGDHFYSIDYFSDMALNGTSQVSLKKPFTLGFWFELGIGKINEYAPRD